MVVDIQSRVIFDNLYSSSEYPKGGDDVSRYLALVKQASTDVKQFKAFSDNMERLVYKVRRICFLGNAPVINFFLKEGPKKLAYEINAAILDIAYYQTQMSNRSSNILKEASQALFFVAAAVALVAFAILAGGTGILTVPVALALGAGCVLLSSLHIHSLYVATCKDRDRTQQIQKCFDKLETKTRELLELDKNLNVEAI